MRAIDDPALLAAGAAVIRRGLARAASASAPAAASPSAHPAVGAEPQVARPGQEQERAA